MTLVETFPGETDADFRAAMDRTLQAMCPDRPNWWYPYELGGTYECNAIRFRDFFCVAGSVEAWIERHARVEGGSRRVIVVPDKSVVVFGGVKMVGGGQEIPVTKEQITVIEPASSSSSPDLRSREMFVSPCESAVSYAQPEKRSIPKILWWFFVDGAILLGALVYMMIAFEEVRPYENLPPKTEAILNLWMLAAFAFFMFLSGWAANTWWSRRSG